METKKIKTVMLCEVITFCHIIDEFESFNNKFLDFLKGGKDNFRLILELWGLSTGQPAFYPRPKVREFYNSNKAVIDTINKYWDFLCFVRSNYTVTDKSVILNEISTLFYQYILANKDKIDKMIALVNKLKELGFSMFDFAPNEDFSKETYSLKTRVLENLQITYLENLEVILCYERDNIQYRTKESAYKIVLDTFSIISPDGKIILNDLTIDSDRLPKNVSQDEIFAQLLALRNEKQEQYTIIRDSVDLSVAIEDLSSMYHTVNQKINDLESVDRKPELLEELRKIKEAIDTMSSITTEHNKQIISSNHEITQRQLVEEKRAYTRRREMQKELID